MDVAGKSLSEVVAKLATVDSSLPSAKVFGKLRNGKSISAEECFALGESGEVRNHGATLLRLVASKFCTSDVVSMLLDQRNIHIHGINDDQQVLHGDFRSLPSSLSIRQQTCHGATALHVAVYRNTLHVDKIIRLLLASDWQEGMDGEARLRQPFSLASISMSCGSFPLHVLLGQNITINENALEILINADPTVITKEDRNGDNCISLLWKNTLRFRWAISIMEASSFIEYIDKESSDKSSSMAITTPWKFMRCILMMLRTLKGCATGDNTEFSIHELCALPRCPPMLVLLAMLPEYNAEFCIDGDVFSLDENGMLPLHHAVKNPPVNYECVPEYLKRSSRRSLVSVLLEKHPRGAEIADSAGRLPLHHALECGFVREKDVIELVMRFPTSLKIQDPVTGLYPFMLVALQLGDLSLHQQVGFHSVRPFLSHACVPRKDLPRLFGHCTGWKKDHVRMCFLLLSLCPEALQYHLTAYS